MRKFALIILALAFIVPSVAMGEPGDRPSKRGKKGPIQELGLDAKQVEAMRNIRQEMRRFMIGNRGKVELAKLDFEEELQKEKPDKAILDKLVDDMGQFAADHEKHRMGMIVQMAEILTPEQKAKFIESRMVKGIGGPPDGGRHGGKHGGGRGPR